MLPNDNGDSIDRIRQLISSAEPVVHGPFMVVPEVDRVYAHGTTLPLLGASTEFSEGTDGLRLHTSQPVEFDYIGTYVLLNEYVDGLFMNSEVLQALADLEHREDMISALVALNRVQRQEDSEEDIRDFYRSWLASDVRSRFDAVLGVPAGGMGRKIVAPQPLLLAIRWLMGRETMVHPVEQSDRTYARAILFTHAIASTIRCEGIGTANTERDRRRDLMLSMMNTGSLSENPDIYSSMGRTVRLWRDYGHLTKPKLGQDAADLLQSMTDLEPEDFLAVGFALIAYAMMWVPGKPVAQARRMHDNMPDRLRETFLSLCSRTLEDCLVNLEDPKSEYDLLALESHPVLETSKGLLVLDEDLLWRRCTSGLFWMLHDSLKDQRGEDAAARWREAHGEMIEALAEDSLRVLAPLTIGAETSFYYTEDDFLAAFGLNRKRCDVGIDFGDSFLLVEIVGGQVSVQARINADLEKLDEDFDRLVISKCKQLDDTASSVLDDESPLTGVSKGKRYPVIVPALVVGGGFQRNSLSSSYVRFRLGTEGILQHPRIAPLALLNLEDIETLEGLKGQISPDKLLLKWQRSDMRDLPLNNFLLRANLDVTARRPQRLKSAVDSTLSEIIRRIGMPPIPQDGSGSEV